MSEQPLSKTRIVFTLAGLIFFIGLVLYMNRQGDKLHENHRYTIATIYKTHWSVKSGKYADSRFTVRGVEYTVSADADRLAGQPLIGRRFLVKFHPPEPDIASLYLNAPIPDDVVVAPAEGWETAPVPVPEKKL